MGSQQDVIAVMIITTALGATSHRDDVARLGRLVVAFAQRQSHVGQGAGNNHYAALAGLDRGAAPKRSMSSRDMDTAVRLHSRPSLNWSHMIDPVRMQGEQSAGSGDDKPLVGKLRADRVKRSVVFHGIVCPRD
jgi:hypothetical protein